MKGWMYILLCSNGQYYTGSTNDLERRMQQHQNGKGANFTKKNLPVELYIARNLIESIRHSTGRNKYRDGAERKRRH
jgi:putative endonuclease